MNTTHTYQIRKAGETIARDTNYTAAIRQAEAHGAEVWDSKADGTPNLRRWSPMIAPARRKVRHVLVNADGSETEFSKVRR